MTERPEYRLREYGAVELAQQSLTASDLVHLRALANDRLLSVQASSGGWRITAGSVTGAVSLDRIRLVVEPKLPISGEQLIRWLCYSLRIAEVRTEVVRGWTTGPGGFADLVVAALLAECRALAADGLRRDYVLRERVEPVLRGRLDATAQLARRYGRIDRLHVRAHERDADIWENRVCGTALAAAAETVRDAGLLRAVTRTAASFPRYRNPETALRALTRARYTRLNLRYRAAHTWAGLVLGGGGATDLLDLTEWRAGTLLLDTPALWESAVRRMCEESARRLGGTTLAASGARSLTVRGDLGRPRFLRPDVLVGLPNMDGLLPVDAKYKDYGAEAVSRDDVYQLLTYSAAYSGVRGGAVIVYPDGAGPARRTLAVGGPAGRLGNITVVGVNPAADPEDAERQVGAVLNESAPTGRPGGAA
ncbi:5-methylcytosine-specific restriction enzyme subunit McrC [Lipingzhangella halophila]|uniref:5-methylcytosine-specific restriction enzyme subunit McrC n=1 Tax=Lipingzhangella halophila TaxID=1783352 RepID=A0A7W7W3P8_9ACTN|nr:PE-PGRS family protein [Lipingzhangella halophila]MBB4932743.1 5-methylcytosine-specific restriction enzyme subunit McrC [Lipingzhangella halophila]